MKRSLQEIVELVVFGLIALLIGTGVLWLLGAVFGLAGTVLGWLAALLWGLLSFLVPVALVAGAVVLIVRWSQGRPLPGTGGAGAARRPGGPTAPVDATTEVPSDATAPDAAVDAERAAESTAEGMPPAPAGTPPVAVDANETIAADPAATGSTTDTAAAPDGPLADDDRRGG